MACPHNPHAGKAKGAVKAVFPIIDRPSAIDSSKAEGVTVPPKGGAHAQGDISLRNVKFV